MIDIATGFNIEPPTAWSTRKRMSSSTVGARLHKTDAREKRVRPMRKVRLRPIRYAVEPENSRRLAITTV
jgi:hypothetical protein